MPLTDAETKRRIDAVLSANGVTDVYSDDEANQEVWRRFGEYYESIPAGVWFVLLSLAFSFNDSKSWGAGVSTYSNDAAARQHIQDLEEVRNNLPQGSILFNDIDAYCQFVKVFLLGEGTYDNINSIQQGSENIVHRLCNIFAFIPFVGKGGRVLENARRIANSVQVDQQTAKFVLALFLKQLPVGANNGINMTISINELFPDLLGGLNAASKRYMIELVGSHLHIDELKACVDAENVHTLFGCCNLDQIQAFFQQKDLGLDIWTSSTNFLLAQDSGDEYWDKVACTLITVGLKHGVAPNVIQGLLNVIHVKGGKINFFTRVRLFFNGYVFQAFKGLLTFGKKTTFSIHDPHDPHSAEGLSGSASEVSSPLDLPPFPDDFGNFNKDNPRG